MEKISVIVPVYNVEKYLGRCIESIVRQTYTNLEIILVNDGSKDKSGAICDEYQSKDSRIQVIHKENGGQATARNLAMKQATGEFFCFIDSDDYIPDNYIQFLYDGCKKYNADISMCGYEYFKGERAEQENFADFTEAEEVYDNDKMLLNLHTVKDEQYVVVWAKLFHRKLFEGLSFPEGHMCEDIALVYKLYDRAEKTVYAPEMKYLYFRNNAESTTYDKKDIFYLDLFLALEEEIAYMQEMKHDKIVPYVYKMLMYWKFDYYCKLRKEQRKQEMKKIHKDFKECYKHAKEVSLETFYTCFYYLPNLYLTLKKR